jgi:hypothetical protein
VVQVCAEIGYVLVENQIRTWDDLFNLYGPDAAWSKWEKYNSHFAFRQMRLRFMFDLVKTAPEVVDLYECEVMNVWFLSIMDTLLVAEIPALNSRSFFDVQLEFTNLLLSSKNHQMTLGSMGCKRGIFDNDRDSGQDRRLITAEDFRNEDFQVDLVRGRVPGEQCSSSDGRSLISERFIQLFCSAFQIRFSQTAVGSILSRLQPEPK